MDVSFDSTKPIYIQIMDFIKKEIAKKALREGEKLPSVREMSEKLKVNPNTVQRAYQELEREEFTFTQRGMGNFVTTDENKISTLKQELAGDIIKSFINGMSDLGFKSNDMLDMLNKYFKEV